MARTVSRRQALGFRVRAQQLERTAGSLTDTAVLDLGVQDTGPDGGPWALALRGVDAGPDDELALAWTLRGAPHLYRRADLPAVAAATAPFSDADAGKRIFDAARPLAAAGIGNLAALDAVAAAMRAVVAAPMVKGEVSARLTAALDEPFLRYCRPCAAIHPYEMPFRLAALRAGLELEPGTSPPVLRPVPGFAPAREVPPRLDVVRGYLRLLGPARPVDVAGFLDAPVREVRARWPADAVEVRVDGEPRWVLAADADVLAADPPDVVRLLGPYDLFLQARDRSLLVADAAAAKTLWPVLGRPGGVLLGGEVAGTWRARKEGRAVRVSVQLWMPPAAPARAALAEQAERLAAHRGLALAGLDVAG
ncbi:winged helix DNA-binding domain-containing protein [Geodermatophilus sp. YIM 151500]|uniref:winged helix DNA-binding domain-containing protein n=1 Tax=Geodermatophilus sp. YIM 151500 TaxID=2984531 RepID=UPI0021E45445|nr:winged helix DNA-binding domain-containing protein [Geodermatophilus sp. YIM 151500]MCV2491168.1 winged helix DNA-binding domain-containing protein [Geodermatophilus sp. YIM 151500]